MALINHLSPKAQKIAVAHSPDSDDLFLFWAIKHQLIDLGNFSFSLESFDTHQLNQLATRGTFDVTAISVAAFPPLSKNYTILPHGACFGRNFGPVLLRQKGKSIPNLNKAKISIPGSSTTAALLLFLIAPQATTVEVPITEINKAYQLIREGVTDAALIIHEGQLNFDTDQLEVILDLGSWWQEQTGYPLPLGVNIIKKSLGDDTVAKVSSIIRSSIEFAFTHQEVIKPELLKIARSRQLSSFTESNLEQYLSMYANEDSRQMNTEHINAIRALLTAAKTKKLPNNMSSENDPRIDVQFAP